MFVFTVFNGNEFYKSYWEKLINNPYHKVESFDIKASTYEKCLIKKVQVIKEQLEKHSEILYLDCDCEITDKFSLVELKRSLFGSEMGFRIRNRIVEPINVGVLCFKRTTAVTRFVNEWYQLTKKEGLNYKSVDQACFNIHLLNFTGSLMYSELSVNYNFMSHDTINHDINRAAIIHHKVSRLEGNDIARKWRTKKL